MADKKYAVIRTDLMSGTNVAADLVSLRVYNDANEMIEVENGVIVELVELEEGQREVWKAKLATASSDKEMCVVVATPEVMYDERKRNLDEFVNEKGAICRGYHLRRANIFSLTPEGFVDGSAPAVGTEVAVGANGKLTAGSGFGKVIHVEVAGRYTYHAIRIA